MHPNAPNELLAQEVTNLHKGSSLGDGAVDGEMGIDRTKFVLVAVGDALDHVLDVGADGAHCGQLFLLAEPFLDLKGLKHTCKIFGS